ncbi:hypothetical protein N1027_15955 [Herbiconiux sp. CPCC 205763]|uniref:FtsX-like permease family protein n=1 Tax=Herbiconiux aconitum TaxID=2970913 RepID=A0ABT2GXG6_9MICO|nr:hypothetical protein [Herbiconiux aconitum]MCS5719626.1 hypothetical protein [Herbiconiux aconitum]
MSFLLALGAVVLIAVALLGGTSSFLAGSTLQAMRTTLADAPPTEAALRVSSSFDPATAGAQDAATRVVVDDAFPGVPLAVWRTVRTAPVPLQILDPKAPPAGADGGSGLPAVVLQSDDRSDTGITTVTGTWPTAPGEAALEERAAAALGVDAGDRVLVGPDTGRSEFLVTALWHADDPTGARWFADPAVASGHAGDAVGPLLVSDADLAGVTAAATTRWVIQPDAATLTSADWTAVEAASRDGALAELLARADVFGAQSVTVEGDLHAETARVTQEASAAQAVTLVPAVLVATLAVIALLQLATLLAGSRSADTHLLRARGASVTQVTLWTAAETAVVAVASAVVGGTLGAVAGWVLAGGVGGLAEAFAAGGVIAAAAAVVTVIVVTARGSAAAWAAGRRALAPRSSGAPALVAALFTAALAAFAGWQLLAAGSPLIAGGSVGGPGGADVNPIAVLAPGVGMLALALFAVAGISPITRLLGAGAARGRSLTRLLAVRTLTRRASLFTVAVLVTTLAAGGAVFAAAVSGSLHETDLRTAALQTGADVRAQVAVPANVDLDGPRVSSLLAAGAPGTSAAATALSTTATLGTDDIGLIGLPVASVPQVLPGTQLAGAVGDLGAASGAAPGLGVIPEQSTSLTLTVTLTGTDSAELTDTAGTVTVAAWLADSSGAISEISLGEIDAATTANGAGFSAPLPSAVGELTLLGLDVARVGSAEGSRSALVLDAAAVANADGQTVPVELVAGGSSGALSTTVTRQNPRGRILAPAAQERVPVLFTAALAERLGVNAGATLTLIPSTGRPVEIVLAATVDAVPGSGRELVAFADTTALAQGILQAGGAVPLPAEVWVATSDPAGTATTITTASATAVTVTTRANSSAAPIFEPAVAAVRAGVAGGVVVALVCLVAVTAALLGARRGESTVLGALGSVRRDDVAERRGEAGAAVVYGLLAGVVAGAVVATAFAGVFARAAVPGADVVEALAGFDLPQAAIALAALTVGAAAVVGAYGSLVRRSR